MAARLRSKFFQTYSSKVLPIMCKMEETRIKRYLRMIAYEGFFIALVLISAFLIYNMGGRIIQSENIIFKILSVLSPTMLILSIVAVPFIPRYLDKDFKKELKSACISDVLKVFGDINKMAPDYDFTQLPLQQSGLFLPFNCQEDDDIFVGFHKGVRFSVIETKLSQKLKSRKDYREQTVFKGVILSFPFNKTIKAHTIITPKNYRNIDVRLMYILMSILLFAFVFILSGNFIFNIYTLIKVVIILISVAALILTVKKYKKVKFEDIVFDKEYTVQSEDQVEARYLITPSFIERFKNLEKAYNSKDIKCAFFNNQIMFAIATNKDLFEVGSLYHSLKNSKCIEAFYDEMTAILDIIENFKLDEKTGL